MEAGPPGQPPRPEYKVYKSRKSPFGKLRGGEELRQLRSLRRRRDERAPEEPRLPGTRRRITPRRVAKWVALAVGAWILLSAAVFFVSAQTQEGVSERTEAALSDGGSLLTGSTILVLGSDERPKGSLEPGARAQGPGRADSILLLRVGFGEVRRLSILRDTVVDIPGHGQDKINASYAIGGPALTVETIENFLGNGLRINHVIEVSFEEFPDLIDALGGIDVRLRRCVRSDPFGGRKFSLPRGEHHLNGRQALAFARIRKNRCAPNEDDRARAARQQQVLSAIRSAALSPSTFLRLPWVSWEAPRTIRTDMKGPGMAALFTDLLTGGSGDTRVLEPFQLSPLLVSEDEKAEEVQRLVKG